MTFQRQKTTLQEAELAWHQVQLIEASLTEKEREYHRDLISWLGQQLAEQEQPPSLHTLPEGCPRRLEWIPFHRTRCQPLQRRREVRTPHAL